MEISTTSSRSHAQYPAGLCYVHQGEADTEASRNSGSAMGDGGGADMKHGELAVNIYPHLNNFQVYSME